MESKEPFGYGGIVYTYQPTAEPASYFEMTAYPAPGFAVMLPNPGASAAAVAAALARNHTVTHMRAGRFIDLSSRVLMLDLTTFNRNLDLLALVRLRFHCPPSGGVTVEAPDIMVLRPTDYRTGADYGRLAVECLLVLFVLSEVWMVVRAARAQGARSYFTKVSSTGPYLTVSYRASYRILPAMAKVGHLPHVLNLALFILVWSVRIRAHANRPTEPLPPPAAAAAAAGGGGVSDGGGFVDGAAGSPTDLYVDYRTYARLQTLAKDVNSFNAFLSYIKIFHYLSFSPRFTQLTRTLSHAAGSLGGFVFVFGIVMFASAMAHTLCFGAKLSGYRSMWASAATLLSSLLGDFDFNELTQAHWLLGNCPRQLADTGWHSLARAGADTAARALARRSEEGGAPCVAPRGTRCVATPVCGDGGMHCPACARVVTSRLTRGSTAMPFAPWSPPPAPLMNLPPASPAARPPPHPPCPPPTPTPPPSVPPFLPSRRFRPSRPSPPHLPRPRVLRAVHGAGRVRDAQHVHRDHQRRVHRHEGGAREQGRHGVGSDRHLREAVSRLSTSVVVAQVPQGSRIRSFLGQAVNSA
jgi:hypothetical protein